MTSRALDVIALLDVTASYSFAAPGGARFFVHVFYVRVSIAAAAANLFMQQKGYFRM